ncbi:MAG: uracil-DNA glycosylase [Deltaproteobacteria bacterium]|nr:uracil-DNA glycosylase [Deltaproteobacteria bacterium]
MAEEQDLRLELLDIVRSLKTYVRAYPHACGNIHAADRPEVRGSAKSFPTAAEKEAVAARDRSLTLEAVRADMGDCQRCHLGKMRTNLVFGEGNPHAELVFVGEAPGGDEDRQGRPFVGRAGQLLTKIIAAMGLTRQDVYICNILKCRPPGNRNPEPHEIAACEPFLVRQLEAINPRVICALGAFAAKTLLKTDVPITLLRGKYHDYHEIKLMPTYHPAYLLRNPGAKKQVWEDVQVIMKDLGLNNKNGPDM